MLKLDGIGKIYKVSSGDVVALDNVSLKIGEGKFYGIVGHSGSGKSTLIQIIGLLDNYSSGSYYIDDVDVSKMKDIEKNNYRIHKFGFVFQAFYLDPKLSALDNVMIPMYVNKDISRKDRKNRAVELLERFGIVNNMCKHKISQLSGGEQQRVAIARALANNPDIIIADEPTGNLDKENEKIVFDMLKELSFKDKKTVIVVSHNEILKEYADVIYEISNGKLVGVKDED